MKPRDDFHNGGDDGADSDSESGSENGDSELWVEDKEAPARALAALNALRKSRQHYDVVLVAGGAEVPAHRALLVAASPYLLQALAAPASPAGPIAAVGPNPGSPPPETAAPAYRVEGVEADSLKELVEYIYTGRLCARDSEAARRLYRGAWRLRLESARTALAERLVRRLAPGDCLETRALPDLPPQHLQQLDAYIADHFDELCGGGAMTALPLIRMELLRASSADGGEEAPLAVAEAALTWLRDHNGADSMEDLCSRTHLVFVDARGSLRDCGELPAARGDAPELQEYRRAAHERAERPNKRAAPPRPLPGLQLGARDPRPHTAVLAARGASANATGSCRVTRALVLLHGRLLAAQIAWRDVGDGVNVAVGGPLGGARDEGGKLAELSVGRCAHGTAGAGSERVVCSVRGVVGMCTSGSDRVAVGGPLGGARDEGGKLAELSVGRCAHGTAVLGSRLVVCGGYDRARVLRACEAYDPERNEWSALPDMRTTRARFPAARVANKLYVIGGSDGHNELDSVDVYEEGGTAWAGRSKLPVAAAYSAAASDDRKGIIYVVGGWAMGRSLRSVLKYEPLTDMWIETASLTTGRSQCAAVVWEGSLWALGGCDAWHCLATTEKLELDTPNAQWTPGVPLPTARRSVGGCVWRGMIVSCGGSDGAASLRRVEFLKPGALSWSPGPDLRRARAALGLADIAAALYAVGGFDGKEFLSCVEVLYTPDGEWTTLSARPPLTAPLSAPAKEQEASPQTERLENGTVGTSIAAN